MKITDMEAIHLRVEDPNIGLFDGSYDDCVIVVHTDEGVTGLGETESHGACDPGDRSRSIGAQPCACFERSADRLRSFGASSRNTGSACTTRPITWAGAD